jgi:seryl-tRNA synthetase
MLDIQGLRENSTEIEKRLKTRDPSIDLKEILELDQRRRSLIQEVEELKARRNLGSQEVARRKQAGENADELISSLSELAQETSTKDTWLKEAEAHLHALLLELPNLPHESVPVGGEGKKVVLRTHGEKPAFSFRVRNHLEIGEEKGFLDFRRGAMIAGTRFPMYVGIGARLEMALIQFMFFHHIRNGYVPVLPPFLANEESFVVSSQLPKFARDIYHCEKDGLYLNPTAESLLANFHRDETLASEDLPLNYVAYTPCFRREAGTYGEEERGLIRVHQFNKVELFKVTTPETSYEELDRLVVDAEAILQALGLHYRVVLLPTEDMAQQASKTIDLEVYLPAQGKYYEVSSCSNCEAFQARRGNVRYRPAAGEKLRYVHMLNGSGLATSRLVAAIFENNQTEDGRVRIPEVVQETVEAEIV